MRGTDISTFQHAYRKRNQGDFPQELTISLQKEWDLKYGENPHQQAAIYFLESIDGKNARTIAEITDLVYVRSDGRGKGGLSLTNTMDITRAMDVLKYFPDPAVVIMKHNIVSGFARQGSTDRSLTDLFRLARDADRRSNFGGTLVTNKPLDKETAEAMYELRGESPFFVDVLAAPEYEEGTLKYIEGESSGIRVGKFANIDRLPKFVGDETYGLVSIKEMPTGRIGIQDVYLTAIKGPENLIKDSMVKDKDTGTLHIIERDPTAKELEDMVTAWWLNITGARSNGVVFVRNGISIATGSGKVERVGAVEDAIVKGIQKAMDREGIEYNPLYGIQGHERLSDNPFHGAVASSDAFFPFGDSVERFAQVGVKAVVQPFGSIRDNEVIDAANRFGIAMVATKERCFGHF